MRLAQKKRGVISVWVVLTGLVFVGILGLAIDMAYLSLVAKQTQNAADAAALGGAYAIRQTQLVGATPTIQSQTATNYAQATAAANYIAQQSVSLAGSDVVVGHFYRPGTSASKQGFVVGDTPYNAVQATANRTSGSGNGSVSLMFGGIFGMPTATMSRSAVAMVDTIKGGVVVLNKHAPGSLAFNGTGNSYKIVVSIVDANGVPTGQLGDVIVNSDDPNGVSYNGNPTMDISNFWIGSNQTGTAAMLPNGATLHPNMHPAAVDPLAGLYSGPPAKPTQAATLVNGVWTEGYYPNGIPGGAILGPGLHWADNGASSFTAALGSLVFINSGDVSMGGNSTITLRKMTPTNAPTYYSKYSQWASLGIGLWIYQGNLTMKGNPNIDNDGVLYLTGQAPSGGNVDIRGTPTSVGSMLITDTLSISGTGQVNVKYNGGITEPTNTFLVQ